MSPRKEAGNPCMAGTDNFLLKGKTVTEASDPTILQYLEKLESAEEDLKILVQETTNQSVKDEEQMKGMDEHILYQLHQIHSFTIKIADFLSNTNGKSKDKGLVVCFGKMLIEFVPTVAGVSLAEATTFKKALSGPANVAICIAKLGGSSAFLGKEGVDELGLMFSRILKRSKVDNSGMRVDPNARTAFAFTTLRADGEREFLFPHPSAAMLFLDSELDVNLINQASIFHYGLISLIDKPFESILFSAMAIAEKCGSILSFDASSRFALWPSEEAARSCILRLWNSSNIIKITKDEIEILVGGDKPYDDKATLKKLFHPKLKLLIVTEGSEGCSYYTEEFEGRVTGVKVEPDDITGADDAFVGAILNSLAADLNLYKDEKQLRESLLFAHVCAHLTKAE